MCNVCLLLYNYMKMLKMLKNNNCEVPLQARRLTDVTLSMLLLRPGLTTEGSGGKEAKTHFCRL